MKNIEIIPRGFSDYGEYASKVSIEYEEAVEACNKMIATVFLAELYQDGFWPEDIVESPLEESKARNIAYTRATMLARLFAKDILGLTVEDPKGNQAWIELKVGAE